MFLYFCPQYCGVLELSIASAPLDYSARCSTQRKKENPDSGGGSCVVAHEQPDQKMLFKEGTGSRYVGTRRVKGGTLYLDLQQIIIFLTLFEMPLYVNAWPV